jgi:molybdenum-dependent DNA-binding transcriptional regulator ModE
MKREKSREAPMDRMAGMAVFTKVVSTGSFSAAARELEMSQASATKQIKELESWLGASAQSNDAAPQLDGNRHWLL